MISSFPFLVMPPPVSRLQIAAFALQFVFVPLDCCRYSDSVGLHVSEALLFLDINIQLGVE